MTFVRDYLGNDGVFILRIIATNTNDVIMSELVCSVWKRYIDYKNVAIKPESPVKEPAPSVDTTINELDHDQTNGRTDIDKAELHFG